MSNLLCGVSLSPSRRLKLSVRSGPWSAICPNIRQPSNKRGLHEALTDRRIHRTVGTRWTGDRRFFGAGAASSPIAGPHGAKRAVRRWVEGDGLAASIASAAIATRRRHGQVEAV